MTAHPLDRHARRLSRSVKRQVLVLGGLMAVMWLLLAINVVSHGALNVFGIIPRTIIGLRGIVFAPFLHANSAHLISNSVPFLALGWLVMLRDPRHFLPVSAAAMLGSGILAWTLGAPGSVHVGASGVIFGYFGFVLLSGWYARSFVSILSSLLVIALWGSVILGVLPGHAGISWQSHLGGFLGGILAARSYRIAR